VLAEALVLCALAALFGILLSGVVVPIVASRLNIVLHGLPVSVIVGGLGAAVLVALISGLPPAQRARRLVIVDALAGR
jgi:putative ABC transport system permease protein